ncbi:efflux RND transporter periplasmic adaptor subunit [Gangjinia marincola]
MKKYSTVLIGIIVLGLGFLFFFLLNKNNETASKELVQRDIKQIVETKKITLKNIPYTVEATGTLTAKQQIELYSEVQGVLHNSRKSFKVGTTFKKGETILSINSEEHLAQVQSNRSNLINQIAAMMPDMEIDYPNDYQKWQNYLQNFDVKSRLKPLPEATSEQEKLFVTGKNVYQTYYTVKNLEARLSKYYISAPFNGEITETLVNAGALVRSGQKLGEFIDGSVFELELKVPATEKEYFTQGSIVELSTINNQQSYTAKISRLSSKIDRETQTILVIIELSGTDFQDGQYLKANIKGSLIKDAVEIPSKLLKNNNQVFIVEDDKLVLQTIHIVDYNDDTLLVKGLTNNMVLVTEVTNLNPGTTVETKTIGK